MFQPEHPVCSVASRWTPPGLGAVGLGLHALRLPSSDVFALLALWSIEVLQALVLPKAWEGGTLATGGQVAALWPAHPAWAPVILVPDE